MDLTQTTFKINGILSRMPRAGKPKLHDMYMFARGLSNLNESQINNIEAIIDEDYKRAKEFIRKSKSQSKTK